MEDEKNIDESWKDAVSKEKQDPLAEPQIPETYEVNFLGYMTSLVYQTMIFLGDIPNPVTQQTEKNLRQAKFLIDTLSLLRDKTKGNLNSEEENVLNGSLYELQMRYVELSKGENIS